MCPGQALVLQLLLLLRCDGSSAGFHGFCFFCYFFCSLWDMPCAHSTIFGGLCMDCRYRLFVAFGGALRRLFSAPYHLYVHLLHALPLRLGDSPHILEYLYHLV